MTDSMQDALLGLGQSIADAALAGLQGSSPEASVSEVTTLVDSGALAEHIVSGIVVADAGSLDGAAGRSLLGISPDHARALSDAADSAQPPPASKPAAADAVDADADADADAEPGAEPAADAGPVGETDPPPPVEAAPTGDLPQSALDAVALIADAMNASAANALTILLGQPVRYESARAAIVEDPRFVVRPGPVQAVCVALRAGDITCHLIQFAPNALVMRAARAFEDLAQDAAGALPGRSVHGPSEQTLSGVNLRVWAELGRTELGLADALTLPLGTVVELDREADAPVDLVVNGTRFGSGRLIVTDEGEWALELDTVGPVVAP